MTPDLETRLRNLNTEIATLEGEVAVAEQAEQDVIARHRDAGTLTDQEAVREIHVASQSAMEAAELLKAKRQEREQLRTVIQRLAPVTNGRQVARRDGGALAVLLDETGRWEFNRIAPYIEADELARRIKHGLTGRLLHATTDLQPGVAEDIQLRPPLMVPVQPPRLIDIITVGATTSDTIRWQRQVSRTINAAPTARGTAYSESEFVFEQKTTGVRDIGHYATLHEDNIADAPYMQTIVEGELRDALLRVVESLIASGDGTGSGAGTEFVGILDGSSGVGTSVRATSETRLDFLHRLKTLVATQIFEGATHIAMHPTDWDTTIKEKASDSGVYMAANPLNPGPLSLWGLPIVLTTVVPAGTVIVGNFPRGAKLWIRRGVDLQISNQHSDYFTRRLVALRADIRAAFYVQEPLAFRIGTF